MAINGQPAGERVSLPYSFDITSYVHPGKNAIRIVVTNTMESDRSVENREFRLDKIKLNGLLGPVRIVPYYDGEIHCVRKRTAAATPGGR